MGVSGTVVYRHQCGWVCGTVSVVNGLDPAGSLESCPHGEVTTGRWTWPSLLSGQLLDLESLSFFSYSWVALEQRRVLLLPALKSCLKTAPGMGGSSIHKEQQSNLQGLLSVLLFISWLKPEAQISI